MKKKLSKSRQEIAKASSQDTFLRQGESCANPWNGKCESTDIILYIYYKGDKLPICRFCWNEIAEKEVEWGGDLA